MVLAWMMGSAVYGQGFNAFNGRNHPQLDWRVAETPHFKIMYPAHLEGIEAHAAAIAEASYAMLSATLEVTFDERIRIYLSDEDEIVNGFAVRLGNGYTNIWVHMNGVAEGWTGGEKWLRKVIAHELAHIFHYRAIRSPLGTFDELFADPLPRFWTEGLAQYLTEDWDAYRGDRWLRTAILDDRLSYRDGRSVWNGRLLYAVGNAQVRYFAEQFGDSTLVKLLKYRTSLVGDLLSVHDFETAFLKTTGQSYTSFYDAWRRHLNIYYNTIAGQMEPVDSLDAVRLGLPAQYLYDIQYDPDTSHVAVLGLTSLARPVQRLYVLDRKRQARRVVAEGSINIPIAWRPDGEQLAFSRSGRGTHGSIVNDLYMVDATGKNLKRLTHSRRASSPTFAPDGQRLAFVGSNRGTANVFALDLASGAETQLTFFEGDVQISSVRWHPSDERLVFARFDADGTRDLVLLDLDTRKLQPLTDGLQDDHGPVWRSDGRQVAYTSFRDDVPNVFIYDLATRAHERITNLALGATVRAWMPPDSTHAEGRLTVVVNTSKSRDRAYRFDAARRVQAVPLAIPEGYAAWAQHRPPQTLPSAIEPNPSLVTQRYAYQPLKNLTPVVRLVLPYYSNSDDWGLSGFASWLEPLGKHLFAFAGSISIPSFQEESVFQASYVNNTWYPTLQFSGYRFPGASRVYGDELLVENLLGGQLDVWWPLELSGRPYSRSGLSMRLRYVDVDPFDTDARDLPVPIQAQEADLQIGWTYARQRPYRYNIIHPLDGFGLRAQVTAATRFLQADTEYLRGDVSSYVIAPGVGRHRLFLYGRAQAQTGTALPQNILGFSRYDDIQVAIPGFLPITLGDAERVRGYRAYALGNRVLFGSAEYRMPFLPSLQTRILGLVSLGHTTVAAFVDAGAVWNDANFGEGVQRVGLGVEVKNVVRLFDTISLLHAVGVAQPATDVGNRDNYEIYYRVRAAVPFQ